MRNWLKRAKRRWRRVKRSRVYRAVRRVSRRTVRKTRTRLKPRRVLKFAKRWSRPRRAVKRKVRRAFGTRTTRVMTRGRVTARFAFDDHVRRGHSRHDIVPGRTVIEWRSHPELGRGHVLAYLTSQDLDVRFEAGGRPPSGVPVHDVRVLA